MSGFRSLNNSTSKRVLNLVEPVKLTVWEVMIERVTVVKFRVNYGGGNGAGCFEVETCESEIFVRIESHIESVVRFEFESNIESNRRIVVYSFNVKFLLIAI